MSAAVTGKAALLNEHTRHEIDEWVARFPEGKQRSAVLSSLRFAQEQNNGFLTPDLMDAVAEYLALPPIQVYEVASFYSMFETRPCGRHHISVCTNISCMLRGGEETPVFCQRVNQFENDADNITREVLTAVRRTFITPFDRGDIKNLITSMDDAIDQMQQTAKAVVLFEVRTFEPPMREMGTLLVECANLVGRALPLLSSIGENVAMLTAITEELTKLEGRVDDLHDIGLKELFLKHRNANTMDFIVGAEIYDHLEKVADRFDDVANEINSIVIEQV